MSEPQRKFYLQVVGGRRYRVAQENVFRRAHELAVETGKRVDLVVVKSAAGIPTSKMTPPLPPHT